MVDLGLDRIFGRTTSTNMRPDTSTCHGTTTRPNTSTHLSTRPAGRARDRTGLSTRHTNDAWGVGHGAATTTAKATSTAEATITRKASVAAVGGWVALLGIVAGDHSGEGGFGEAVEGGIRADCFGQRCQERQPGHPVWCRAHGHPTGGHRAFHPRHDCGSVDVRGDPPCRSREGPVAQRRQVGSEAFIHHAALLTGQAGGLTHDQGGPVFTEHPTGEGGHGVGHLHMQSVREPDMLITPGR